MPWTRGFECVECPNPGDSLIRAQQDCFADYVDLLEFQLELREYGETLPTRLREEQEVCDEHRDIAPGTLIDNRIDST